MPALSCERELETIRAVAAVRAFVSFNATFASDAVGSGRFRNAVAHLNDTILEAFDGPQIQGHVAVTSRYQWCLQSSKKILPSPQSGEMFIETLPNTTASLQRSEMYST